MAILTVSGNAVFSDGVRPTLISFDADAGKITSVEDAPDLGPPSRLLFPGFIDIHVHAREYPRPEPWNPDVFRRWQVQCRKEVFRTAGEAAINGGVTLFGAMPNDPDPPADEVTYNKKTGLAARSPCPVVLYSVVTPKSEPWSDLPYKVYLDCVENASSFSDWSALESALERYKGRRVFFHAEDPVVLRRFAGAGPRWRTRPPEAEVSAVAKALELTGKLSLRSHICHVSTEKAVSLISEYNAGSATRVTCEAAPHHLFFSIQDERVVAAGGQDAPVGHLLGSNPPLRAEHDRRFMVEALRDGLVDVLASDHAPHTLQDKAEGAPGMPHLDTLGGFACWLIKECRFTPERVAEFIAAEPARIFAADLDIPSGTLTPGAVASFTALDLDAETLVVGAVIRGRGPLKTRCAWSPFSGVSLPGAVVATTVRGKDYPFLDPRP